MGVAAGVGVGDGVGVTAAGVGVGVGVGTISSGVSGIGWSGCTHPDANSSIIVSASVVTLITSLSRSVQAIVSVLRECRALRRSRQARPSSSTSVEENR